MRTLIGFVLLILAAISIAMFASRIHPGGDLPPNELEAEKSRQEAEDKKAESDKIRAAMDRTPAAFDKVKANAVHATLVIEGKQPIELEFYPAAAPQTVEHVVGLIKSSFYTGIKVHRVEEASDAPELFQFGDPESTKYEPAQFQEQQIGTHGSGITVPLEIKLPNLKYSIGLARAKAEDSGDSQLYINTKDNGVFDGAFCVFGRVVGGQDTLTAIKVGDKIKSFSIK